MPDTFEEFLFERNKNTCHSCWVKFIYIVFLLLIVGFVFLIINSSHWYYTLWALFSLYCIPRNLIIIQSSNIAYHSSRPQIDFPMLFNNLFSNTIESYFTTDFIPHFMEQPEARRMRLFGKRIILPLFKIVFWLTPFIIVFIGL